MRELVEELNIYAHAYYMEDTSLISEWTILYFDCCWKL